MSIGMILLIIIAVLTLFGITQRVLDGLRLTDRGALLVIAAIFIGGLIPNIPITSSVSINLGGAVIPVVLCIYLFIKADTNKERWRTVIAVVITTGVIYALGRLMPNEPEYIVIDPNYICGIVGAVVAYVLGRSRRGAFIAAVMGVLLSDVVNAIVLAAEGRFSHLTLGGGGYFDVVLLSGIIAVVLAEVVGEIIERISQSRNKRRKEQE